MKLAVLIQCHKCPRQVNELIQAFSHPDITVFVHVDRKSDITGELCGENLYILPDSLRVDVQWGTYSQVDATLHLLRYAKRKGDFDAYCLLSGQDYPTVSAKKLLEFLSKNPTANYVNLLPCKAYKLSYENNFDKRNTIYYPAFLIKRNKVSRVLRRIWVEMSGGYNRTFRFFRRKKPGRFQSYFGSSWWLLSGEFTSFVLAYLEKHKEYEAYFKHCLCADESFFQTLLMNSPYANTRKDYLHYIDWSEGNNSPKNLTLADFDSIIESEKLFARKIDNDFDLIKKLQRHME